MSKGWYVKVDIPVRFNMDCNIGVVATSEFLAKSQAMQIVEAELKKTVDELKEDFPWDFKTGCLEWNRGAETLDPVWHEIDATTATPDPDYDPEQPDEGDLMDAAMCLLEAFWNLPDEDLRKSNFLPNHGIAVVRDNMATAAKLCHQLWCITNDDYAGDCFDWDFCPRFLDRCMDEQMVVKSNDLYELKRIFEEG